MLNNIINSVNSIYHKKIYRISFNQKVEYISTEYPLNNIFNIDEIQVIEKITDGISEMKFYDAVNKCYIEHFHNLDVSLLDLEDKIDELKAEGELV